MTQSINLLNSRRPGGINWSRVAQAPERLAHPVGIPGLSSSMKTGKFHGQHPMLLIHPPNG